MLSQEKTTSSQEGLGKLNSEGLARLRDDEFRAIASEVLHLAQEDRKLRQILYYQPVSKRAMKIHESMASVIGAAGGNGSGKSESVLVDIVACATGVFPHSLAHLAEKKFKGPINCRIVVESLTNVLEPTILPKLQWFRWSGIDTPGGTRGHWGWIPKDCLIDGSWEKSYSSKLRLLRLICRDPKNYQKVIGESSIQFMSHDNDPTDFASGDFHKVMLDEPPKRAIFRENQARTMRVNGQIYLAMTWPDDPSIPVDWIYDEIYDRAKTDSSTEWVELLTTENLNLNQDAIRAQMAKWDKQTISVRIEGKPIRFSNRVHPLFTNFETWWSFKAGHTINPIDGKCPETGSTDIEAFNHVEAREVFESWPVIQVLDPHPRKPHMFLWAVVTPQDDIYVIAEGQIDDTPNVLRDYVFDVEKNMKLNVKVRLIDPNMGASPASATKRENTWRDEFREAGLFFDLADDSAVGRARLNEYLKPDQATRKPRIHIHPRCKTAIHQLLRYSWDEYRISSERDPKQVPRDKNDDFPTMLKYLMNYQPDFRLLAHGAPIIRRPGRSKGY